MRLFNLADPPGRTRSGHGAVIFDMDGVVTDTATMHAAAWKALFDQMLALIGRHRVAPFDPVGDYRAHVDGRSREDGVRVFLAARGLAVPEGAPGDAPDRITVYGLAARKQQIFEELLASEGVTVFPDARELLAELHDRGVPTALVTASRNSAAVLDAAGITQLFTVRVDGADALRQSFAGKPDPAMFTEAARRLSVPPCDAVVFEDAVAGVRAAVTGGFGLVVGVDRAGSGDQLRQAGADEVVTRIVDEPMHARARVRTSPAWCGGAEIPDQDAWTLVYQHFDPVEEGTREALCTLGNGYWASRGAAAGACAGAVHYPATYFAGVYNRVRSTVGGRATETEHLVNAPDWTHFVVRHPEGDALVPGSAQMISHRQELDVRRGVLTRINRYGDPSGRILRITSRRLLCMSATQLAAEEFTVEAENFSGTVIVESGVNARVSNRNVAADRHLSHTHLNPIRTTGTDSETILARVSTRQSGIGIAIAVRTRVGQTGTVIGRERILHRDYGTDLLTIALQRGRPLSVERTAAAATSRDRGISTAALASARTIAEAPGFDTLLADHIQAWAQLWDRFGIGLAADAPIALALNLHIFHVLQTAAAASADLDAGLPARGLHGEGYRGHVFWDELFVYPTLTLRCPELTRSLLLYRYRRLPEARAAARRAGLPGALFPWQSGSDGREETPAYLLNIRDGKWLPDNSSRQQHVGLAVAYSIWQYYQSTADIGFLADYGAEVIVEVARFFAGRAVHDPADDRFDIIAVMGPDEFHDGYPDAPGQGLRTNAYTNVLTAWVLARAQETVALLGQRDCHALWRRLGLQSDELTHWRRVGSRLRIDFHDGVISQFHGYDQLDEFDWTAYRNRYGNIGRLDLILAAEGDSTNRYKLSKQADVLMLFYLFSAEELRALFEHLGYSLPAEMIPRTVGYYLDRTSHGSTLSRLAHAWVLARTDRRASWSLFAEALHADLADTQGGTTREGVHLGAMAGTADMVMRCYAGVETRDDRLLLHPVLPAELTNVTFMLRYRGQPIDVELGRDRARVFLRPCAAVPVRVCIEGAERTLTAGQGWEVGLTSAGSVTGAGAV